MSKTLIVLCLFFPTLLMANPRPTLAEQTIQAFQQKVKSQTSKKDIWESYEQLLKNLDSKNIVINNPSQLIYMNSLMIALDEITKKDFNAGKCPDMSARIDKKFLEPSVSFQNNSKHYQDAKNILKAICK